MSDEAQQPPDESPTPETATAPLPPGHIFDQVTGQPRPMTFIERARQAAGAAASTAAKVSVDVGSQAAKAGADIGGRAAAATAATIKDPATKARARAALKKAKHGFTTALERIDPKILADVVVKATSLQEKANASLKARDSAYRIGEITIGASFPPSIQFSIVRLDDPEQLLHDSSILLAKAIEEREGDIGAASGTIVGLDGTEVEDGVLDALDDDE
ncbi:MAG: hypothetical protein HYX55_06660 [Chloroflexi bacterium]|nr:hypothetical protein [Chloroflexota bacterium]